MDENEVLLNEKNDLLASLAAREAAPDAPSEVPSPTGLSDVEFLGQAESYLAVAHAELRGSPRGAVELDAARERISAWRAEPEIRDLLANVQEARSRLGEAANEEAVPVSPAELGALPPLERAEAEVYNIILDAFTEPLAEGEEGRDRMESRRPELELWQAEIRRLRRDGAAAARDARISELQATLNDTQ